MPARRCIIHVTSGSRYGKLVAIDRVSGRGTKDSHWLCKCDCGVWAITTDQRLSKGNTKSCGCLRGNSVRSRRKPVNDPWDQEIKHALYRSAAARKIPIEITKLEAKQLMTRNCHYCNAEPRLYQSGIVRNGIDRKDPASAYSVANSIPCCSVCNYLKSDLAYSEFLTHIMAITRHIGQHG